jgi:hypothetical protein
MEHNIMNFYDSLNDAALIHRILKLGATSIWYHKPDVARDICFGLKYCQINNIKIHILLGRIDSKNPDEIFIALQSEEYSPEGQARRLIKNLELTHTSMSVGDIIEFDGKYMFCDNLGWTELKIGDV